MSLQTSVGAVPIATAGQCSANSIKGTKANASLQKDTITVTSADLATVATVNSTAYVYDKKTVTITAADLATTATVNGTAYTVNAGAATATKTEIATLLVAAINAGETLSTAEVSGETCVVTSVITAQTVVGTTNCTVAQTSVSTTLIAAGLAAIINANESNITATSALAVITTVAVDPGTAYTAVGTTNCTVANVNWNAVAIPFGLFVCADANDYNNGKLPTVATDITSRRALGFTPHTNTREQDDGGWRVDDNFNFVKNGRIWAVAEESMDMSDTVYVRFSTPVAGSKYIGAVRSDSDSTTAAALDGCSVLQYDATTGLVELSINLPS